LENKNKLYKFSIYRFNSESKKSPYMQKYQLELNSNTNIMLLKAIEMIKEQNDSSLSFRRSCGEGVCGSDGMNINGKNSLACITPIDTLKQPIILRPLPGLPVIRDLVVDMKQFYKNYEKIQPFLQGKFEKKIEKERLQSPKERKKLDGSYECILCGCCNTFCPSFWWNPKKFIGPAALLQAYRFVIDSRDIKTQERLNLLKDSFSLFRCRSIMNCVSVCPKKLDPHEKINKLKILMLKYIFKNGDY